ncbi:hypothetical protein MMC10_009248 [Thelotrema lepadinum]|nr:hypothetical protein [Thelotrema lepadinum]
MHYMDECSGLEGALPARMIKKMATQVLDALRVIHDSGRSMKGLWYDSFVIVYDQVQPTNEHEILKFFGQKNGLKDQAWLNETGTGPEKTQFNEERWSLKLVLTDAEPYRIHPERDIGFCEPPEILLDHEYSPASDIWDFGKILADWAAGTPAWCYIFGCSADKHFQSLVESQHLLGPLPPEIKARIPKRFHRMLRSGDYQGDALYLWIRDNKLTNKEWKFLEWEQRLLADLVKKMMVWRPEDRLTAEEALKHDFFG